MNRFNYYITTHFILNNKDYNFYHNFYLMYQMYPKTIIYIWKKGGKEKRKKKNTLFFPLFEKGNQKKYICNFTFLSI